VANGPCVHHRFIRTLIAIAGASSPLADGLTYEVPAQTLPGTLLRVPLRKQWAEGIVIGEEDRLSDVTARAVGNVLHAEPLLPLAHVFTARWMAGYYRCSLKKSLTAFLPFRPWATLLPPQRRWLAATTKEGLPPGPSQRRMLDVLRERGTMTVDALREETGVSSATVRSLLQGGWITDELRGDVPATIPSPVIAPVNLTPVQRRACDEILASKRTALLFGVTGSGKTEIYAELVRLCMEEGGQAVLLVPEILLTEHAVGRFRAFLGDDAVAVIHSKLTLAQRRDAWRRCRSGAVRLVVGSRSALFAPCPNLKLVVIDEEHEWTYKSEHAPRYHARETAEELCRHAGARLVLGTATPSVEAWHRATTGIYTLVRLPERYGGVPAPSVRVIDLADVKFGSVYPFSAPLLDAIGLRLERQEQSVLFLNRRGIASALLCLDCRRRLVSVTSGMPYTVHKNSSGEPFLVDHVGGETRDVPERCPGCGSARLHAVGAGTHRAEAVIAQRFPSARIVRADADTLVRPEQMRELLEKMRLGEADILIGTQSVVKGLDLPGVTLAAVLVADVGLSIPHFRAGERVFQLLAQLVGRSGRHRPGEVIIQTFRPAAEEVMSAATGDIEGYLERELKLRSKFGYPPATEMVRLLWRGPDARLRAEATHDALFRRIAETGTDAKCSRAPTLFGGGREWHVLLRGTGIDALLDAIPTDAFIDRDPIECC
jgi:primosomal protein N' (replication factor Y)